MKSTWFISDTHFSHANIIRYSKRPFADFETHDAAVIENWNRHVKQGDDVCFLGDFSFRNRTRAEEIRRKLQGQIFFIEGNHDSAAHQIRHTFAWYHSVKIVEVQGQLSSKASARSSRTPPARPGRARVVAA
jgi:calcineurin-like phosphoesterase family protein